MSLGVSRAAESQELGDRAAVEIVGIKSLVD